MARKGFYEELRVKEYISELTPKMCKYVNDVMDGTDDRAKENLVCKILPKIIDKGLPTMITGDEGGALKLSIEISERIANKLHLNDNSTPDTE